MRVFFKHFVGSCLMALHQHLRNSRRATEVAIDLKWGMGVEKIRIRVSRQRFDEHFVRVIAAEEAGPEIDLPGFAPAGAAVAAEEEGLLGGGAQLGGGAR